MAVLAIANTSCKYFKALETITTNGHIAVQKPTHSANY